MWNIFKRSIDDNSNIPKKIPEILFNENNSLHIECYSRITPNFEEMLCLQYARQMFQKYLRTYRLHKVLQCFQDLSETKSCTDDCPFIKSSDESKYVNPMIKLKNAFAFCTDSDAIRNGIVDFECVLLNSCTNHHIELCIHIKLYRKYLLEFCLKSSEVGGTDYVEEVRAIPQIIIDEFLQPQYNRLPSLSYLQKALYDYLKDSLYPEYLQSIFHQKYQLQLLNVGLNTLRLSDFIHSDHYLNMMTEFLDGHGLSHYIFFLMVINKLSDSQGVCSFTEALDIYSKYLVMGSKDYISVPSSVSNCVANIICQHHSEPDCNDLIDVYSSFSCVYKPVYIFIEQFWLPQFIISATYQEHLNKLTETVNSFPGRNRNYSDTARTPTSVRPFDHLTSEDDNSDISVDTASVQSEPAISLSETSQKNQSALSWWPPKRLENRLPSRQSRPMTLGSFDDLGRYQSINSPNKRHNSSVTNSSSSEILSTITELSNDIWNKVQINGHNSRGSSQYPDDVARQIIDDVYRMTLRNL